MPTNLFIVHLYHAFGVGQLPPHLLLVLLLSEKTLPLLGLVLQIHLLPSLLHFMSQTVILLC